MPLDEQLRELGAQLDLDGSALTAGVLDRLDVDASTAQPPQSGLHRLMRVAAVLLLAVAALVALTPSARAAVADWFGLDGVTIERDSGLDVPSTADALESMTDAGDGTIVGSGEIDVLVSEFPGSIDTGALAKTLGDGTDIVRVDIAGSLGLWIDGEPHEVAYLDAGGQFVVRRFAGNTLLWQDGDVIRRLEGFESLSAALDHVATLDDD